MGILAVSGADETIGEGGVVALTESPLGGGDEEDTLMVGFLARLDVRFWAVEGPSAADSSVLASVVAAEDAAEGSAEGSAGTARFRRRAEVNDPQ